jgi:hypothetical protein
MSNSTKSGRDCSGNMCCCTVCLQSKIVHHKNLQAELFMCSSSICRRLLDWLMCLQAAEHFYSTRPACQHIRSLLAALCSRKSWLFTAWG